ARTGGFVHRRPGERAQGSEMAVELAVEPALEPGAKLGPAPSRQPIQGARGANRGLEQRAPGREAGEDVAVPADRQRVAILDQTEIAVGGGGKGGRAAVEFVAQATLGRRQQQALVGVARGRVDLELEPGEVADWLGTDADL